MEGLDELWKCQVCRELYYPHSDCSKAPVQLLVCRHNVCRSCLDLVGPGPFKCACGLAYESEKLVNVQLDYWLIGQILCSKIPELQHFRQEQSSKGSVRKEKHCQDGGKEQTRVTVKEKRPGQQKAVHFELDDQETAGALNSDEASEEEYAIEALPKVEGPELYSVSRAVNPHEFYVTKVSESSMLDGLAADIEMAAAGADFSGRVNVNDVVGCQFCNKYVRGVVKTIQNGLADLYLLDSGQLCKVSVKNLFLLCPYLSGIPSMAHRCSFEDLVPYSGEKWTLPMMKEFEKLLDRKTLELRINVADDETLLLDNAYVCDSVLEKTMGTKDVTELLYSVRAARRAGHTYARQEVPASEIRSQVNDMSPGAWYSVIISGIESLNLFYVYHSGKATENSYEELLASMNKTYNCRVGQRLLDPSAGDVCAARSSHDDNYYRVRLVEQDGVYWKGFLVDYGSHERLHQSTLRPLDQQFFSLPEISIPVRLQCVAAAHEGGWTKKESDCFFKTLPGGHLQMHVHEIDDDNACRVTFHSANYCLTCSLLETQLGRFVATDQNRKIVDTFKQCFAIESLVKLQKGEEIPIEVSHVISPSHLYVTDPALASQEPATIPEGLPTDMCRCLLYALLKQGDSVMVGQQTARLVAMDTDVALVYLTDKMRLASVNATDVVPSKSPDLPSVKGVSVHLHMMKPCGNSTWTFTLVDTLQKFIKNQKGNLLMKFCGDPETLSNSHSVVSHPVQLYYRRARKGEDEPKNMSINQLFIDQGLALPLQLSVEEMKAIFDQAITHLS